MVDPAKDVRIAAAQAMGYVGTEAAGLLLRLKARIGDRDPEVLSECLSGLLTVNPAENLAFVAEFLEPGNAARCEAAALALGKSRLPDALDPLKACWPRCVSAELREQVLLAIAMMRLPAAIDYLMELVASDSENGRERGPVGPQDPQLRPAPARAARADRHARRAAARSRRGSIATSGRRNRPLLPVRTPPNPLQSSPVPMIEESICPGP